MKQSRLALFRGRHFEPEIIVTCVRWYLRFSLSLQNVEELMAERGLIVDHTVDFYLSENREKPSPQFLSLSLSCSALSDPTYLAVVLVSIIQSGLQHFPSGNHDQFRRLRIVEAD
jgi:hypothetical protein